MSFQVCLNQYDKSLSIVPSRTPTHSKTALENIVHALTKGFSLSLSEGQTQIYEIAQAIAGHDLKNPETQQLVSKIYALSFNHLQNLPAEVHQLHLQWLPLRALLGYEETGKAGRAFVTDIIQTRAQKFGYNGTDLTEAKKYLDVVEKLYGDTYSHPLDRETTKKLVSLFRNVLFYDFGFSSLVLEQKIKNFIKSIAQKSLVETFEQLDEITQAFEPETKPQELYELLLLALRKEKEPYTIEITAQLDHSLEYFAEGGSDYVSRNAGIANLLVSLGASPSTIAWSMEVFQSWTVRTVGTKTPDTIGATTTSAFEYYHLQNVNLLEPTHLKSAKASLELLLNDHFPQTESTYQNCLLIAAEKMGLSIDPNQQILKKILPKLSQNSLNKTDASGNNAVHLAAKEGNIAFLTEFKRVCPPELWTKANFAGQSPLDLLNARLVFVEDGGTLHTKIIPQIITTNVKAQIQRDVFIGVFDGEITEYERQTLVEPEIARWNEGRLRHRNELEQCKELLLDLVKVTAAS